MATYDSLWHLVSNNQPTSIKIPPGEVIYTIDLPKRIIEGPEFVGVLEEHDAELIYFKTSRFFDLVDLADTSCFIQYETINKQTGEKYQGVYLVPAYDTETFQDNIVFAWDISNMVTQSATTIKYNFRFIKVDETNKVTFDLNTLTANAKVLDSLYFPDLDDITEESDNGKWGNLLEQMMVLYKRTLEAETLYWEEA